MVRRLTALDVHKDHLISGVVETSPSPVSEGADVSPPTKLELPLSVAQATKKSAAPRAQAESKRWRVEEDPRRTFC